MNSKIFLFVLSLIFFTSFVLAMPEINFQHEEYQPGEIIIGTISGVENLLSESNIKIFEDRRELQIDKNVFLHEGINYFYFTLSKEGEYLVSIENLNYLEENILKEFDFEKNLSIFFENSSQILGISKGFVISDTEDFELFLTNLGYQELIIGLDLPEKELNLSSGKIQKVYLETSKELEILNIETYKNFDIYLINLNFENSTKNNNFENKNNSGDYNLTSQNKTIIVKKTSRIEKEINFTIDILGNFSDKNNLIIDADSALIKEGFFYGGEKIIVTLKILFDNPGFFERNITFIDDEELKFFIPLEVYVFNNSNQSDNFLIDTPNSEDYESCSDLGGNLCQSNENCESPNFSWAGGLCCFDSCVPVNSGEKKETPQIFIGLIIILFVGAIGYFLYRRFKKGPTKEDKFSKISSRRK